MAGAAHGGRPSLFLTHMAADRTQDVADAATLANAPKPFAKSTYPSLARVQVLHCRAQKLSARARHLRTHGWANCSTSQVLRQGR